MDDPRPALGPESAGPGSCKLVTPKFAQGGQKGADSTNLDPPPAPGPGDAPVYQKADPEPQPPSGEEVESQPRPAQVGGSGLRLPSKPGTNSRPGANRPGPSAVGEGAGEKGAPLSLPFFPDPGGVRDPRERGGGPGARPLARSHAQQQLLRVQPQLLHGEGERERERAQRTVRVAPA